MRKSFTLLCILLTVVFAVCDYALVKENFTFLRGIGIIVCTLGALVYAGLAIMCIRGVHTNVR